MIHGMDTPDNKDTINTVKIDATKLGEIAQNLLIDNYFKKQNVKLINYNKEIQRSFNYGLQLHHLIELLKKSNTAQDIYKKHYPNFVKTLFTHQFTAIKYYHECFVYLHYLKLFSSEEVPAFQVDKEQVKFLKQQNSEAKAMITTLTIVLNVHDPIEQFNDLRPLPKIVRTSAN